MTEVVARIMPRSNPKAPERIPASRYVLGYINRLVDIFVRGGAVFKMRALAYALTDKSRSDVLFVLRDSNEHQDLADIMGLRGRPDEIQLADILTELWQTDRVEFGAARAGVGMPNTEWMKATLSVLEKRGGTGHEILEDLLGFNWRWELRHF
jgi:hypothetical protein